MSTLFENDFFGFSGMDNDAEFIPLITAEEEDNVLTVSDFQRLDLNKDIFFYF